MFENFRFGGFMGLHDGHKVSANGLHRDVGRTFSPDSNKIGDNCDSCPRRLQ